jgi:hypothetical protein
LKDEVKVFRDQLKEVNRRLEELKK